MPNNCDILDIGCWTENKTHCSVNKLFHSIKVWLTCLSKINIINKYHSNTVIATIKEMSQSLFYAICLLTVPKLMLHGYPDRCLCLCYVIWMLTKLMLQMLIYVSALYPCAVFAYHLSQILSRCSPGHMAQCTNYKNWIQDKFSCNKV